jgi:integrase
MSVIKRSNEYYIYFRPLGEGLIGLKTSVTSKREAKEMETMLLRACRTGDYASLDLGARELCVRMFRNKKWEMPSGLLLAEDVKDELSLWEAVTLFLKHPEIKGSSVRERHEHGLAHLVEKWGKDFPIKQVWIPQIKQFQMERLSEGAAASTVNKEKAALSKVFQVLIELRHMDVNPARLVRNLSEKSGQRQVYIGWQDFQTLSDHIPSRFLAFVQTAYYTGMRRGEIQKLKRHQVRLGQRMILIGPEDTKEGNWKRIPIHRELVPVLEGIMKVRVLGRDEVFLVDGAPIAKGTGRRPWENAVEAVGLNPEPHFHDLRHTWKTNARRSGMDPEIRESIMGHWFREKSITERYGRIGDQELLRAIDQMTFDHGPSEIFLASSPKEKPQKRVQPRPGKNVNRVLTTGSGQSTGV